MKSSTGSRSLAASGETTFLSNTFTKLEGNSVSFGTPFEHDFESSSISANVLVKVSDVVFTMNKLSNIFFMEFGLIHFAFPARGPSDVIKGSSRALCHPPAGIFPVL